MAGPTEDWRWIDGHLNISDIITRGATPEELDVESEWQCGPEFLRLPEAKWPVQMAGEIVNDVADKVKRLQRKAFSAVVTRAQAQRVSGPTSNVNSTDSATQSPPKDQGPAPSSKQPQKKPWGVALMQLVEPKRFSTLLKLCGTIAWVRRAAASWLNLKYKAPELAKWGAKSLKLSAEERTAVFQDLALAAQDGVNFQDTTLNRLVVTKDPGTGLLLCGGRVQSWSEYGTVVPLIPFQSWMGRWGWGWGCWREKLMRQTMKVLPPHCCAREGRPGSYKVEGQSRRLSATASIAKSKEPNSVSK